MIFTVNYILEKNHFIVIYKIIKTKFIYLIQHLITYKKHEFVRFWIGENSDESIEKGIALLLEVTPEFYKKDWEKKIKKSFFILNKYLFKYKELIIQLIKGLIGASLLSLLFPFLAQSVVDIGIHPQNIKFIYLIHLLN